MAKRAAGPPPPGDVVKELMFGNTRVLICDGAYRNRTLEDQRGSLENVSRAASQALSGALAKQET
jgi:hypothetical protein